MKKKYLNNKTILKYTKFFQVKKYVSFNSKHFKQLTQLVIIIFSVHSNMISFSDFRNNIYINKLWFPFSWSRANFLAFSGFLTLFLQFLCPSRGSSNSKRLLLSLCFFDWLKDVKRAIFELISKASDFWKRDNYLKFYYYISFENLKYK